MERRLVSAAAALWALVACSCATTQSAEQPPAPVANGAPAAAPAPPPDRWSAPELVGGQGVVSLCALLRDEDKIDFAGNEVERARAAEAHRTRRQEAAARSYAVQIAAGGFGFGGYDLAGRRLLLDVRRTFAVADGVELFPSGPDATAPLAFELGPEAAERVIKDHERGALALRLLIRPADSELRSDTCVRLSGGNIVKLPVQIVAYTLVAPDGRAVARGETGAFAEDAGTTINAPHVVVRRPKTQEGREVTDELAAAAAALAPSLLPCYRRALEARPTLRGTLILEVRVGGDGQIDAARMEVSALGDDALVACVVGRLSRAKLGRGAARLSLPIAFGSKDDL